MVNPKNSQFLFDWQQQGLISGLDLAFAEFIFHQEKAQPQLIAAVAALVSRQLSQQHVCCDLQQIYQQLKFSYALPFCLPEYSGFVSLIQNSGCVGAAHQQQPLILDNGFLYLQRYWLYETQLAQLLAEKAAVDLPLDKGQLHTDLALLFATEQGEIDWQKVAVCLAASKALCVITGGPGTGKTTTVTRLMALVQSQSLKQNNKLLDIQLVAPTGKAAARLGESIIQAKQKLPEALQKGLPDSCSTIHRLLGVKPNSPYFAHDQHSPLHLDMLIVDEASMVDLPLMAKLFQALPEHCRIVLLGDKEQLASVEVGNVLGDMCQHIHLEQQYSAPQAQLIGELSGYHLPATQQVSSLLSDNLVMLRKSHRFSANSGIGQLAHRVNRGEVSQSLALLKSTAEDLHWYAQAEYKQLLAALHSGYKAYFAAIKQSDKRKAFKLLAAQQVLCATRKGQWGVEQLNLLIETELSKQGLIKQPQGLYAGKPVMLKENEHNLQLFNGDIGIVLPDENQQGLLKVWFVASDGELRSFLPGRLPAFDTVYAMTIHKSQGSEFEQVFLCFDPQQSQILSRELIYTGITRAKQAVSIFASQQTLAAGIQKACDRGSGLAQRLLYQSA